MIDQYPIISRYTYLNTASHGLISKRLLAHRRMLDKRMHLEASLFTATRAQCIASVRTTVAHFIHADSLLTAVLPNLSIGYNLLMNELPVNSRFLLLENDYPSVHGTLNNKEFTRYYVPINEQVESHILEACKLHKPDFFCFSLVHYITGIMISLDFIRDLKVQFPDMVIIADLTQYVGVEEFRFRESGIDIILASCYKWLHAGEGNGFIAFKPKAIAQLISAKSKIELTDIKDDLVTDFMAIFEPGHQDMIAFSTLQEAIKQAQELGWPFIETRTKSIGLLAKSAFTTRNLLDPAVVHRAQHSTIFNIKGDAALYKKLLDQNIITSLRGEGIRISFSYFNTKTDLDTLLAVLDL